MSYINICKRRVRWFYNETTLISLSLWISMVVACEHDPKLKFEYQIICFTIGAIKQQPGNRGHAIMSSILCKNRVFMAHQLSLLEGMLTPLFKSTMMSLKIMRNPVINEQHTDKFVYKQNIKILNSNAKP